MGVGPLQPFDRSEALSVREASAQTGRKPQTIRLWCARHRLGRHVGGQWAVSKVALRLFLNNQLDGLAAYLAGDRRHADVAAAYRSEGVSRARQEEDRDLGAGREMLGGAR